MSDELTAKERAFCLRYVLGDGKDPIGAYVKAYGVAEELVEGPQVAALLERNDIRLEVYGLQRIAAHNRMSRVLLELEEARQKALAEPIGAMDAAQITLAKAQLQGLLSIPALAAEAATMQLTYDDDTLLPGERKPETVH